MAVQQGYGKMAGANSLVFAYDTGDTVNSFKGEPTENLINGVANPTLSTDGWGEDGWSGDISVDTDENALVLTATNGWHSIKYDFGVLNAPITISFKAKLKSKETTNIPLHVVNGRHLGDYDQWLGSIPTPTLTEYQEFTATFTPTERSLICLVLRGADTLGQTDEIYIKDLQVEQKSHATPFVNGTRSATEGLKDLTGDSAINLTNISFDSNAQIEFDGTDDRIQIPNNAKIDVTGPEITLEVIARKDTSGNRVLIHKDFQYTIRMNSDNSLTYADSSVWSYASFGNHSISYTNGSFIHITAVKKDGVVTLYANGEVIVSKSFGGNISSTSNDLFTGAYSGSSNYLDGKIPVTKIYNRALTAAEVETNFNNYKTRFNIS